MNLFHISEIFYLFRHTERSLVFATICGEPFPLYRSCGISVEARVGSLLYRYEEVGTVFHEWLRIPGLRFFFTGTECLNYC